MRFVYMKNLFIKILILSGIALANVAFANRASDSLYCIALNNWCSVPVDFLIPPGPGGDAPIVNPNERYILPAKYMSSCFQNQCTVLILPTDGSKPTTLWPVAPGSVIIYWKPNVYYVSQDYVLCP